MMKIDIMVTLIRFSYKRSKNIPIYQLYFDVANPLVIFAAFIHPVSCSLCFHQNNSYMSVLKL